jgi:hypothetical protein
MDGDRLSKWKNGVRGCWYIRWLVLFTQNGDNFWNFLLNFYIYPECVYHTAPMIYTKRKESSSNFLVVL